MSYAVGKYQIIATGIERPTWIEKRFHVGGCEQRTSIRPGLMQNEHSIVDLTVGSATGCSEGRVVNPHPRNRFPITKVVVVEPHICLRDGRTFSHSSEGSLRRSRCCDNPRQHQTAQGNSRQRWKHLDSARHAVHYVAHMGVLECGDKLNPLLTDYYLRQCN